MTSRYQRQTILPEIGPEGQEKISNASVLCIGAGGLGSPALLYLAAAGVGRIGIVDFDDVDETNLQRQVLFAESQRGENKTKAAKDRLSALNSTIEIQAYPEELTDQNAADLFKDYDVIIDGTDNFAAKFLINDAALKTGKPFIYGSILGFNGQLSVFGAPDDPCYRCLFPEAPDEHVPSCAEAGVIGAVAGLVGTAQAMEAIKLIVGHESFIPLAGTLWTIDTRTMETKSLSLSKNPDCPACSKERDDIPLRYASPVCGITSELTPDQVRKAENALIIDVRENEEWETGHIEGAQHLPLSRLMEGENPDLDAQKDIILYCQHGIRSLHAAQILKNQGFLHVSSLAGGYKAWLNS